MADLFEIKRTPSHPALISFTKNGIEGLHHADAEVACRNHKKDAVLETFDVIVRVAELFQQQGSVG